MGVPTLLVDNQVVAPSQQYIYRTSSSTLTVAHERAVESVREREFAKSFLVLPLTQLYLELNMDFSAGSP